MFFRKARAERARLEALALQNDPTLCRFVSSKGLMRSCEIHQQLPNDAAGKWPRAALKKHQPGQRIYVHATAFGDFVRKALPKIKSPFVLVSGDSTFDVGPKKLGAS